MSLPDFSTQAELFSTAGLSASLFASTDRYRLFAKVVYPHLVRARASLEPCYCADNGRLALEPVLMLGVSLLQYLDGAPDRQAVEWLRYHAGWNFALNRQVGDPVFHPSSLVNFRQRLEQHQQSALVFTAVLEALQEAGLLSRPSRQRLDSTQMLGRVARMSRLDCVRESLRLALQELEVALRPEGRPVFWLGLWERYVESQTDYRASSETLARKLVQAGSDAWQLLQWLDQPERAASTEGPQLQLLRRVFAEQFEMGVGPATPAPRDQIPVASDSPSSEAAPLAEAPTCGGAFIQPKAKGELVSQRVQNPHEPEAAYAAKGQGEKKKEHVGYKVQVAETVCEAALVAGEPTRNFIVGMVTHPAYESDEAGAQKMQSEQSAMGLEKPAVQYVDGAYVSAESLVEAAAQGRQLIGPAAAAPNNNDGHFTTEAFQIEVEQRQATCPAGHPNSQCSRLEEKATGKVSYRFEWDSATCAACPLRLQCIKVQQKHRTLVVGEHHTALQARRQEQRTAAFKERMKQRNGIEGTQSELVRGHGLRQARYRGLAKARLQNYFIGAACNVKRWLRRIAWELEEAAGASRRTGTVLAG
jgi:transposase